MRLLLLLATLGVAYGANLDPKEIVRRSLSLEQENGSLLDDFVFLESVETRKLRDDGSVRSSESKTHEIMMIEGSPYRRLVARDGTPIPREERRQQEESLQKALEARRNESAQDRAKRIEQYEKRRDRYKKAVAEIPEAFLFTLVGEEVVGSRSAYVVAAKPRPGYDPIDRYSKLYTGLEGTLWIDKTDSRWVRLEAELVDTVTFGWILVRIGKGARVRMERTRFSEKILLPSRLWYTVSLRIGLIKTYHGEEKATYTNYRRMIADGGKER